MSYQFESSSPPSLSSSISSLCSSDSSPPSSFISSYFTENNDIINSHQQQHQQYHHHPTNNNNHHHHHHHHHHHQQQQQQHHHHYHYQQHHLSQNVHNNFLLVTDQNQAKTKKEDYDYSILNIIPNLISEKRKKTIFVEKLVDMTCHIIEIIWADMFFDPSSKVISLKVFVKETLRRSRTSYSTLQATLLYLFRIKSKISLITDRSNRNNNNNNNNNPATCCRRMFLAALIIASKYLQDCNYSNRAWSRVSGLPINELNTIEICFLRLIDYNLFISENNFKHWSSLLLKYIQETFYFSGTDSRKDSVDNNNYYHHHHHHHHHHPHNHPFINDILENQHSIVKLQEIMKSMDEFESLDQRSCQNDLSSGKYQNRKSTRIMTN